MMELYIETLTGTAFELRVSPYETVQDVKARIQKLEGKSYVSCQCHDSQRTRLYLCVETVCVPSSERLYVRPRVVIS